ncbi:hypothetical protein B0H14DRAFT_2617074 [Mycena olivaceomarginata]|nr:hypothetical protein B0H14DRAFT_2617074 [Mycena olivaceomarginata]
MVYCPCCGEDVPSGSKVRHLRANGWKNVKKYVETANHNLTSRILQKFRKRQRPGERSDSENEDQPPRKAQRDEELRANRNTVSPPPGPSASSDFYPDMDVDQRVPSPPAPLPNQLPTTRPRLVTVETCSSTESGMDSGPELVDADDDDLDPELDDSLLTRVELSPGELLDGYLESEENQRGTSRRFRC